MPEKLPDTSYALFSRIELGDIPLSSWKEVKSDFFARPRHATVYLAGHKDVQVSTHPQKTHVLLLQTKQSSLSKPIAIYGDRLNIANIGVNFLFLGKKVPSLRRHIVSMNTQLPAPDTTTQQPAIPKRATLR